MKEVTKRYKKIGDTSKRFLWFNKKKDYIMVIDGSQYKSKKECQEIEKKAKKDQKISELYPKFKKLLYNNRIIKESYKIN